MLAVYFICVVPAVVSALILAACAPARDAAGPAETPTPSPGSSAVKAAGPTCPADPPLSTAAPEWTLAGATGSVAVTGSTDTAAPVIDVQAPFSVTETQVRTLQAGDGAVVAPTATVSVCYMGVNGRDGSVFDSSYERGEPVDFPSRELCRASRRRSPDRRSAPPSRSR